MAMTAVAIAWTKDLFAAVMLMGIYGLLSASFFVSMDAVDVAFTEAAVGAGISPILMLVTLAMVGRRSHPAHNQSFIAVAVVVITGALLIVGTLDMPPFGAGDAPVHQHVAPRYIEQSYEEIGIPNIVTSILASYRAFDTLGEVAVIFTAGIGVITLLMVYPATREEESKPRPARMSEHTILRVVSKMLIPPILLFALYVQFHGEYGPGGGFQAGVIFAAAIILYSMLFGVGIARKVIQFSVVRICAAVGLLLYGTVGLVSLLSGKNYLDYSVFASDPVIGQHVGIILIELGVGMTVASVMIAIYFAFSGRISNRDGST